MSASLAYFYGWTHDYIESLDYETVMDYFMAITVLDAQSRMIDMNIQDYPRMTKEGRKSFFREMRKKAYPKELQKEMSFEDFARKMNG